MKTRNWLGCGLLVGAAVLAAALAPRDAQAQMGGMPSGTVFSPPHDARAPSRSLRSPDRPSPVVNHDPYDPNVWLAQSGVRWHGRNRSAGAQQVSYGEPIMAEPVPVGEPEEIHYEFGHETMYPVQSDCETCHDAPCGQCGGHGGWCCFPCPKPKYLHVMLGVQGFKGPPSGTGGNFGFHEGVNLSGPIRLFPRLDIGYQVGVRTLQSDLSGTQLGTKSRNQTFFTAGLFHQQEIGLQYGVVWDWLRDEADFYDGQFETNQLRANLSLINQKGVELGSWVAINTRRDTDAFREEDWKTTSQYAFYYRRYLDCGGWARLWGGFTGSGDALFGGDAVVPISEQFALGSNFNYLIPEEGTDGGAMTEGWNIGISFIWYPGCKSSSTTQFNRYRPMFDVADNGTMMLE